ncbi:replication protein A 70 kDa DNA-binding subunit B-like [Chenopodium quinoa]|uniref:replication protein A 70 kDa DNA-binding subunit B-like n=1 Tax=Chenopodium quinoa TaxID=63459 RepID=UPI000B773514|nr:replication protein A 70 kDa DNA-binding subunit B-like [Chenopodium quinoa]
MPRHFEIVVINNPYQLTFAENTLVQPICSITGEIEPEFEAISAIAKAHFLDEICDVLGIVLFVENEVPLVDSFYGHKAYVREVVITYQTNTQPIIVNVWNHLAGSACEKMNVWAAKFIVVGFTLVKACGLKGFSLSSGMDTRIIYEPKGDRANVLRVWSNLYVQRVLDRQGRILQVRYPENPQETVTVQYLKEKKVQNALQDESHWLPATIPYANLEQLTIYTGCLKCGKPTNLPKGRQYACTKCYAKKRVACIRVAFTFDAVDNNDIISLTAFNNEAEKILGMHAEQIYAMKENEDHISFEKAKQNFSSKLLHLKVAPIPALTATNKLQWSLEAVIIKGNMRAIAYTDTSSGATSNERIDTHTSSKQNTIIDSMEEDKTMKEIKGNTDDTSSATDGTVSSTTGVKDYGKGAFPN